MVSVRRKNLFSEKITFNRFGVEADSCPFCGSKSISAVHRQVKFIGMNDLHAKKIYMKCYCTCNKCSAKSKAVNYIGYADAQYDFYDENHPHIYSDDMKIKAVNEWNRRCVKND